MGLAGIDSLKPIVKIEVLGGLKSLSAAALEQSLVKFQFISKQGKGKLPVINMEFDNSDGSLFNPLVLATGLKLGIRFGYEGRMSTRFVGPIKSVRANCLPDSGQTPMSARPDAYGTVVMEMQLQRPQLHLKPENDKFMASGPMRISDAMRRLAKSAGYTDRQTFIQPGLSLMNSGSPNESMVNLAQIPTGETMLQYMRKLAVERGFYLSATEDEFRFHRPGWKQTAVEVFNYAMGPDVLSMSVEGDYAMNVNSVHGTSYDPYKGAVVGFLLDSLRQANSLAGISLPIGKSGHNSGKLPDTVNPKDLVTTVSTKLMEATVKRLYESTNNKWSIKMAVVGNPLVTEGCAVLLGNFGPIVDGMWIAHEVEHRIDADGYTTGFSLRGKKRAGGGCPAHMTFFTDVLGQAKSMLALVCRQVRVMGKIGNFKFVQKKPRPGRKGSSKPRPMPGTPLVRATGGRNQLRGR